MTVQRLSLVVSTFSALLTVCLLYHLVRNDQASVIQQILWGCGVLFLGGICFCTLDISRRQVSDFHGIKGAFDHYLAVVSVSWIGWFMRKRLDKDTKHIKAVQEDILMKRLKDNTDTVYGKEYKFADIKSRDNFVRLHPLTRYSHYEPYIQRMTEGEENILTKDRPIIFAVTSGTSGKSNVIPMIRKQGINFFLHGIAVIYDCMLSVFTKTSHLQKTLKFFYTPRWRTSNSGIPVGPNSSSPTNSKQLLNMYSTPKAGYNVLNEPEALYVHLLFGLKDKKLGIIEANFASMVYTAFQALELHSEQLLADIENGCVNPKLDIDEDIRKQLDKQLTADPERASELREAFKGGKAGLVKRIWPECHLILTADSGAFDLYGTRLRNTYGQGIPLYSPIYAASEGLLGVNIWPPERPSRYMLIPKSIFFEFIPIAHCEEAQPSTLFMDQVEVGEIYELVVTNSSGLWRYRFGDVVKVLGVYNQCPVIEFMYRQGQFLNVRGEKTSEAAFYEALCDTAEKWVGVKLIDYCCVESVMVDKVDGDNHDTEYAPYYYVFLEVESSDNGQNLSDAEKNLLDETLCSQSYVYGSFRKKGSILPMKICIVQPSTFQDLRTYTIKHLTASSNQYKVPRVLKRKEAIEFVMERALI